MLITKTGIRWPKPDLFSANVQRHGHHKDQGNIGYEHDEKVLLCDPPTAAEHDANLGLAAPESEHDRNFHAAADLLEALVVWLAESANISSAGRRALALAYALRPGSFPDRSTGALAVRMGTTRQSLLKYVSQVYQLSHGLFVSRTMRPKAYRERQSKNSLAYHRRKSHTLHAKE